MTVRTLTILTATILLAGGTAACSGSNGGSARAGQAVEDTAAVKEVLDSLQSGFAAAPSPEQTARFTTDDAVIAPPGGARWDSLRAALREGAGAGARPSLDANPRETLLLGEDWAYKLGTTEISYAPSGASDSLRATVTSLILFRKTADGWKIHRVVSSPNVPQKISG